ncbi:hypothetical protein Tco_0909277 [Tanacetum coccineum]|uniref:Uncharacterized protein n=1 Tax=Tanacetum coccineum TaxID=301880 RepID=A0ABQ5CRJ2_9ASTR
MANLKYSDKHNMVAFLKKPNKSVDFTEVVDFLKGTSLRSYEAPLLKGNISGSAEDSMQLKELIDIIPKLVTRIETLEIELQQTKTTYGKAVLTLVKKVKILEKALKRKTQKVVITGAVVDQGEGSAQPTEPHHTPVDPSPPHPLPLHHSPPHSPL